jgi:hypothetical protein
MQSAAGGMAAPLAAKCSCSQLLCAVGEELELCQYCRPLADICTQRMLHLLCHAVVPRVLRLYTPRMTSQHLPAALRRLAGALLTAAACLSAVLPFAAEAAAAYITRYTHKQRCI